MRFLDTAEVEALARRLHAGQTDKSGRDYADAHLADVARRVRDAGGTDVEVQAAWLHDAVEDTPVTPIGLVLAGVHPEVVGVVLCLTHHDDDPRERYLERIAAYAPARTVKLADTASNSDESRLVALDPATAERLRRKYAEARRLLGAGASGP